jgi:hypothetical protein
LIIEREERQSDKNDFKVEKDELEHLLAETSKQHESSKAREELLMKELKDM